MGWDEDACGEFYVFIHPRLIRLLDRFRNQGKPFESYLWAVLGWQLRNFARERSRDERRWKVSLRLEPGCSASLSEGLADNPAGRTGPSRRPSRRRRLLRGAYRARRTAATSSFSP